MMANNPTFTAQNGVKGGACTQTTPVSLTCCLSFSVKD